MVSVTQRISQITQPRGGYLSIREFKKEQLDDGKELNPNENIHPANIGMVVDYLSRFITNGDRKKAFFVSLRGAERCGRSDEAEELLKKVRGLDDQSIDCACKLTYFDGFARGRVEEGSDYTTINPDHETCENIAIMATRVKTFLEKYGPVVKDGFIVPGFGAKYIDGGDGDYLTADGIWDIKVLKRDPEAKHTLQLLVYYLMAKHLGNPMFSGVQRVGFFNPRYNIAMYYDLSKLDPSIVETVERDVIGYGLKDEKKAIKGNPRAFDAMASNLKWMEKHPDWNQSIMRCYFHERYDAALEIAKEVLESDNSDIAALFMVYVDNFRELTSKDHEIAVNNLLDSIDSKNKFQAVFEMLAHNYVRYCREEIEKGNEDVPMMIIPELLEPVLLVNEYNEDSARFTYTVWNKLIDKRYKDISNANILSQIIASLVPRVCYYDGDIGNFKKIVTDSKKFLSELLKMNEEDRKTYNLIKLNQIFLDMCERSLTNVLKDKSKKDIKKALEKNVSRLSENLFDPPENPYDLFIEFVNDPKGEPRDNYQRIMKEIEKRLKTYFQ